jgi:hypothetical protein
VALVLVLGCLLAGKAPALAGGTLDPQEMVGCYISMGYWNLPAANEQFSEMAASGVNFVIDYALIWPDDPAQQDQFDAYLSMAGRHGVTVAYCLFNALEGASPHSAKKQIAEVLEQVEQLRDRPQLSAWYVHDEILPELSGVDGTEKYCLSLQQMEELYGLIRELDPQRPQLSVWNQLPDCMEMNRRFSEQHFPHGFPDWMGREEEFEDCMQRTLRRTCDWVMVDCYPVGAGWLEDGQSLPAITAEVDKLVRRAAALKSPEQPLIFVYQSFDWRMYGKGAAPTGFPSMEQLRAMLQAGFEAGADNVLAYSWFDLIRPIDGRQPHGQARCLADLKILLGELAGRS